MSKKLVGVFEGSSYWFDSYYPPGIHINTVHHFKKLIQLGDVFMIYYRGYLDRMEEIAQEQGVTDGKGEVG